MGWSIFGLFGSYSHGVDKSDLGWKMKLISSKSNIIGV
jgi:hypothetical protein